MARVLVTGVGGPAGRSVAALLLDRGHRVVGVDARDVPAPGIAFSTVPLADDVSFLAELSRVAAREAVELVIPTVTEELPVIASDWSAVSRVPALIGSAWAVAIANDKYLTSKELFACGVTVPRYRLPSEVRCPEDVARALGWPCLSKPRVGRGGRGVTVWRESDWHSVRALDDGFILQEFMPGTDYCPNVFVSRMREEAPVVVVLEKTRLKEGIVGNAAEVRKVTSVDVMSLACAAARALDFTGPLDVDIRRRADGEPAVLEINARFGANIFYAQEVLDAALQDAGLS